MNRFKVGDKIAIYENSHRSISEVVRVEGVNLVYTTKSGYTTCVHYKQCRLLRPKKKPIQFWMLPPKFHILNWINNILIFKELPEKIDERDSYILVREVIKK